MFVVSPTAILYNTSGIPLAVSPNVTIPVGTSTLLMAGTDGTNARIFSVDATGRLDVAANQGTAAALAGRWPVQVTDGTNTLPTGDAAARSIFTQVSDGTNGPVAVKAASTAALAADQSLVTAFSPNSPLPAGTNAVGVLAGKPSTGNFTTTPLAANATYTGPWEDVSNFAYVSVQAFADQASASEGFRYQWSSDGVNQELSFGMTVNANVGRAPSQGCHSQYFRVQYVNGPVAQTTFRLRALYHPTGTATNEYPIDQVPTTDTFAPVTRSLVFGQSANGSGVFYDTVVKPPSTQAVVTDPSLVVQITPNQPPIPTTVVPATSIAGSAIGRVSGLAANTFTTVRQTTYVEQTTQAQRSIVSTSASDSAAGTGARQVRITYLDATCAGPFTETVTLNGTTAVNTVATNICFIERMDVISTGSNGSNVGTLNLYTGTGATGTIFAAIGTGAIATGRGDNQTLYAHHYVPVNYEVTGYYVSVGIVASAGGGSSVTIVQFRDPTVATSPWLLASDIINAAQGNSTARTYYASIKIPGPLVLAAWVTPANNNSTATCSFDYADAPI